MVTEITFFACKSGSESALEAAFVQAGEIFDRAKGCKSAVFQRSIETTGRYLLSAEWETLDNHRVDFRASQGYQAWRALVMPHLVQAPVAEHVELLASAKPSTRSPTDQPPTGNPARLAMNPGITALGGRLPLLDPKDLRGDQSELYDLLDSTMISWAAASGFRGKVDTGELIGPFNANLYSVGITPAWVKLVQDESENTSLDKRVHEVVILTVGAVWNSPYELYAHSAMARRSGISDDVIQALAAGRSSDQLSPKEQIAHRFARQLVIDRKVDGDLYREAESAFGRTGIVDMVYLIGMYLLTCAILNVFEVPAPD